MPPRDRRQFLRDKIGSPVELNCCRENGRGAEPLGSAPLDTVVRTAGSLVAAEVGHGLIQARVTDVTGQVPYPLCCDVSFSFAGVHFCASRCNHAFSHQNPLPFACFSYAS